MLPRMKWYERIIDVRINIIVFNIKIGSGFEYRLRLQQIPFEDWTDQESSDDDDF